MGIEESILSFHGTPLQIWSHVKANEIPKFRFLTQPLLSQESFSKAPSESNSCFMTFSLKKKKSGFNRRNITVVIDVSFLLFRHFFSSVYASRVRSAVC